MWSWCRIRLPPALLLLALQVGLGQSVVIVLLPVLVARCGVGFASLAMILAVGAAAFLVAAPLLGRLGDRIGRRRVLLLAAGGIAAGQVLFTATAEAASLNVLPVALVLIGLALGRITYAAAAAGAMPVAQAYASAAVAPERRLATLAQLSACVTVGRLLAPPLAALATLLAPFAPLHLLAVLALVSALAATRLKPQQRPSSSTSQATAPARTGPILAAMLVMMLVGIVQISLGPWIEQRLGLHDLAASRWLGMLLGLAAAGALAAQLLLVPRLRSAPVTMFTVAALMLGCGALMLELATLRAVSFAGALVLGLSLGAIMPLCAAAVAESAQAGGALGRLSAAQVLGQAAGAGAGAALLALDMGTFVVTPVLALLAVLAFAMMRPKRNI